MGMTITEKILSRHADLDEVRPGMLINARVDIALGNDITAPIAIDAFRKAGGGKVFDREKVVLVADHFAPNKDIDSAEQCKLMRDFALEQRITHYYEVGEAGVEHALLPEKGIVVPGDLVIGADSHTCTYGAVGAFATGVGSTDLAAAMMTGELWFKVPETMKFVYHGKRRPWVSGKDLILYTIGRIGVDGALYRAMEFTGETVRGLTMADRLTMANMAIEAGAKNGIFIPDAVTEAYCQGTGRAEIRHFTPPIPTPCTIRSSTSMWRRSSPRSPSPISPPTRRGSARSGTSGSISRSSAPARTAGSRICASRPRS